MCVFSLCNWLVFLGVSFVLCIFDCSFGLGLGTFAGVVFSRWIAVVLRCFLLSHVVFSCEKLPRGNNFNACKHTSAAAERLPGIQAEKLTKT